MTRLAMIRHADTAWNRTGRIQGSSDIGLDDEGRAEAAAWALPGDLADFRWLASPMLRALETAEILIGARPVTDERLREMNWGGWEGHSIHELRENDPEGMRVEEAKGLDTRGPGGESPRDVQDRLRPLLAEIAAEGAATAAVCHRGVIRAVYALATGWDMKGKPPVRLTDGCVHYFRLEEDGKPVVEVLNVSMGPE